MSSREELVTNASQRVQVVARIRATTLQLLAARISRRSVRGTTVVLRLQLHPHEVMRRAEIQDAQLTLAGYKDVSWLKVAMNNSALVSVHQSCAQLLDQLPSERLAHRRGTQPFNHTIEGLAVEQFHGEKDHVPVAVQLVNVHYVSMR